MSEIRLQKYLSQCGIASRRAAEKLIQEGQIRVNGVIQRELGSKIDPAIDEISYLGKKIKPEDKYSYYLLHKPRGYLVTRHDPEGRKTIYHLMHRIHESVKAVGRLDYDSEGLLLMTNDGELAYRLTHPSYEIKKTYLVYLKEIPSREKLRCLEKGIMLDGEKTSPAKISVMKSNDLCLSVQIHEGKKRQVRRMFEWAGSKVLRLIRVKLGSLELGTLKIGTFRPLTSHEVSKLKKEVHMEA